MSSLPKAAVLPALFLSIPVSAMPLAQQNLNFTDSYVQTGPNTVTFSRASFSAIAMEYCPCSATGSVTLPSGETYITPRYGSFLLWGDTSPDKASRDAKFGFGSYKFSIDTGTGAIIEKEAVYSGAPFALYPPQLKAEAFDALQGFDPSKSIKIKFNRFITGDFPAYAFVVIFNIYDENNGRSIYSAFSGNDWSSDFSIPENLLLSNTNYSFNVEFGSTAQAFNPDVLPISFTQRTTGTFRTGAIGGAVPEPSTWLLLTFGFGVIGGALRHSRRGMLLRHA